MAYKVFTNGSPLPASDLNTYLMNQSVMVFANSTDRSAALTAPTEGMVSYLEDTNQLSVWTGSAWVVQNPMTSTGDLIVGGASGVPTRIGIGTNGQVLRSNGTTATWQTLTLGQENWVEILPSSGIPTGSTSAVLSGFSGYQKYLLVIESVSSTVAGTQFFVRLNSSSTNYLNYGLMFNGTSTYSAGIFQVGGGNSTGIPLSTMSSNAASLISGNVLVTSANNTGATSQKYFQYHGAATLAAGNNHRNEIGSGLWANTNAVTSFQISTGGSGNIDGGSWALYGSVN